METIEQLEHIIEELERKVNSTLEKTTQLQRASEKALDTAMHAYKLDEYGYLWVYEAETQTYRKTEMRVATPEIINDAIKAKHIAEGAITGDKVEAGAVVPGKIADDAVQTRNIKDGNVSFDKLDEATKNIVITGGGQHGIPLSPEFGDSDVIGMSQKALTESRDDLLERIENVQVREQSDWEQTDEQAPTYIKNKPNIPPSAIVDPVPTINSPNAVGSGGVFDALQAQDAITASFSADGKIYYNFKAGDIFYVEQDGVHKYRVAYFDGTADEDHPVTIDGLRFYFANNAPDALLSSIRIKNVSTEQQQLTNTQKSTARENIAAVAYEKQELTSAQQVQLQNNMMGKEYAPADFSGLGKKVFAKNVQTVGGVDKNIMTQAFFEDAQGNPLTNSIFVIHYDYELGEDITIPANSVLQFDGGSISGDNVLTLQNTLLFGSPRFDCNFAGQIRNDLFNVLWISSGDIGYKVNKAGEVFKKLLIPQGEYVYTTPIALEGIEKVVSEAALYYNGEYINNTGIFKIKNAWGAYIYVYRLVPNDNSIIDYTDERTTNTVGLEIQSCNNCEIHFMKAEYFNENLRISDINNRGCSYNKFFIGILVSANANIRLYQHDASNGISWTNENTFVGGRLTHWNDSKQWGDYWNIVAGGPLLDKPSYRISGAVDNEDTINGLTFVGTSIEAPKITLLLRNVTDSQFIGMRQETNPGFAKIIGEFIRITYIPKFADPANILSSDFSEATKVSFFNWRDIFPISISVDVDKNIMTDGNIISYTGYLCNIASLRSGIWLNYLTQAGVLIDVSNSSFVFHVRANRRTRFFVRFLDSDGINITENFKLSKICNQLSWHNTHKGFVSDTDVSEQTIRVPKDSSIAKVFVGSMLNNNVILTVDSAKSCQVPNVPIKGTTANRPVALPANVAYFDTDLGKPVFTKSGNYNNQTSVWVDAAGATV